MYESFLLTQVYMFSTCFKKNNVFYQQPGPVFFNQDVDMVIEAVPEIMDLKKWLGSGGRSHRAVVGSCRKFQQRKAVGFWGNKKEAPTMQWTKIIGGLDCLGPGVRMTN